MTVRDPLLFRAVSEAMIAAMRFDLRHIGLAYNPHRTNSQLQTEILALRTGMWTAVKSRLHKVSQLIPVGTSGTEVMLYGTVHYVLKDGRQTTMPWAGRAKTEKEDGEWKMGFYQVYIVSTPERRVRTASKGE
jgi:hypothetical protein